MSSEKKVLLVFPGDSFREGSVVRGVGDQMKEFAAGVEDVAKWFKDFKIDSIVISIKAGVEAGGIIKLILSAKGEGGLTVTLKPRQ